MPCMKRQYLENGTKYKPSSNEQLVSIGVSAVAAIAAGYLAYDALCVPDELAEYTYVEGVFAGILGLISLDLFLNRGSAKTVIEGVEGVDYPPGADQRD